MFFRVTIFMMLALGLAGFGAVAWISTRTPAAVVAAATTVVTDVPPPPPPARISVLIAAKALRAGALVRAEDLGATEVATTAMKADSVTATSENRAALAGAMLRNSFALGEELRSGSMLRPGDRGFLAAVLTPGTRAVSVAVDAVLGVGGLIWPGDHVDMLLTQAIEEAGVTAGRRFAGETVLSDLRIVAVDRVIIQGAVSETIDTSNNNNSNTARTVTVEVTPEQAERVAVAGRMGRISLSVRASSGQGEGKLVRPVIWARDISSALGGGSGGTVNVYAGPADKKEFKF